MKFKPQMAGCLASCTYLIELSLNAKLIKLIRITLGIVNINFCMTSKLP